jgi:hypothetical protein
MIRRHKLRGADLPKTSLRNAAVSFLRYSGESGNGIVLRTDESESSERWWQGNEG